MTEEELKEKVKGYLERTCHKRFDARAEVVINICRDHFDAIPDGMEEWWVGASVSKSNRSMVWITNAHKDKSQIADDLTICRILLPKPESERQKLVRELREMARTSEIGSLLHRAADELEKDT